MSEIEARAEVFFTAFKSLSKPERDAVVARITEDRATARDLLDWATAVRRKKEPSEDFERFVTAHRKRTQRR